MQQLGTRVGETLEQRFVARLHATLDDLGKGGFAAVSDRGLGLFDEDGSGGLCIMSVDDVARLAAAEALAWHCPRLGDRARRSGAAGLGSSADPH